MFSFIHAADIHLGSPFSGLAEVDEKLSAILREATFRAFENIIDECIERKVDFLIVSGDVYDGDQGSLHARLRFRDELARLSKAGIRSFVAHGNHDPLNGWTASLKWPDDVCFFDDSVNAVTVSNGNKGIVDVYGISFPEQEVRTNLSRKFIVQNNDRFKIGVLHCNVGANSGYENYAPCTVDDLKSAGIDYWALGHVHEKKLITDSHPWIVYPGTPQGRNIRESGARGCYAVNVESRDSIQLEFIPTDIIRWTTITISIHSLKTEDDLISKIHSAMEQIREDAEGRDVICRIIVEGRGHLHKKLYNPGILDSLIQYLREQGTEYTPCIRIEKITLRTNPEIDKKIRSKSQDMVGELLRIAQKYKKKEEDISLIKEKLAPLYEDPRLRRYLKEIENTELITLIDLAENLCLNHLIPEDEE